MRLGTETTLFVAGVAANVWPCGSSLRRGRGESTRAKHKHAMHNRAPHASRHTVTHITLLLSVTGTVFVLTKPSNHDCVQGCYQRRRSGECVPLLTPIHMPQLHICLFESLVYSLCDYCFMVERFGVWLVGGTEGVGDRHISGGNVIMVGATPRIIQSILAVLRQASVGKAFILSSSDLCIFLTLFQTMRSRLFHPYPSSLPPLALPSRSRTLSRSRP